MKIRRENRLGQIKNDKDRLTMRRENRRDKVIDRRIAESCVPWLEWRGHWRLRKVTHRRKDELKEEALHAATGSHEGATSAEEECEGTFGEEAQRPG